MNLQAPELLIILVVVLLLFGAKKLPDLAKSLGQAQKEFKDGMKDGDKAAPAAPAAPASPEVTAVEPPPADPPATS